MGAGLVLAAPALAHAAPLDLFYERAVMQAADARCGLFGRDLAQALAASAYQARGAALRAGATPEQIAATGRTARDRAAAVDCRSPDMTTAAGRVRQAFAGFARLGRLSYPGDIAGWQADRIGGPSSPWRLRQETALGGGKMSFGLAGPMGSEALIAVASFPDGAQPYSARLVLRDLNRCDAPYLERTTTGSTAGLPLNRRLPPAGSLTAFMAEARSRAGGSLLPDAQNGWAFRFPASAMKALMALDPRESVAVEFLFPGDVVRRAYVEVGDFAAGAAFVQMASR